jgi:PadR family transcriptional regulator, regulatory protein PadR
MGDVATRKTSASFWVLAALLEGPAHGYAIAKRSADLSDDGPPMGPGTLYGTLARLHAEGSIEPCGDEVVDGRNRRIYRITEHGRSIVKEDAQRLASARRVHRLLGTTALDA